MPIRPENKNRYPKDWKEIRARILERVKDCCEICGIQNYTHRAGSKIVLTISHTNHIPEDCSPENLKALCQRCHNTHDAPMRAKGIRQRRIDKIGRLF